MATPTKASTIFINPPCPHLPSIEKQLSITHTRTHRQECSDAYHLACTELAQSLWRTGSPAQAILQLDKSMMADSADTPLTVPYTAILWIILNSPSDQFLGNPVRHFQHLASRMNMAQPNAKLRVWQAWACLHITEAHTPEGTYPRDLEQIEKEKLVVPTASETLAELRLLSPTEETNIVQRILTELT